MSQELTIAAKQVINHWQEFGPESGFDEIVYRLEKALSPTQPAQAAQGEPDDRAMLEVIDERDRCHEWADKLADAIAEHTGWDIGEHSSANNPWSVALEAMESHSHEEQPAVAQGVGEVVAAVREALEFYADGGHEVELHGKIPWVAERDRLHDRGFHPVCEAYNGSETFVEGGQKAQAALALLDTQPAAGADVCDTARLDALARPGWELSMNNEPECLSGELWQVHRVSGGRNDREWTLIGEGANPRAAIDAAIAASGRQS